MDEPAMPTITLKRVPPSLHHRLKEQAARHFRSLNSEILACLSQSLEAGEADHGQMIATAQVCRSELAARGVWLTDEGIRCARDEGRP
jgi:plasmid stability protein